MINRERISEEFARMASISSPSFREAPMSEYLVKRFSAMGAEVRFDQAGPSAGSSASNLIARFPANGKDSEPLMLSAHMDTVEPADNVVPLLEDGVFRSAADTVLGADDKAGLAEIIEALEVVREQNIPCGPVEVVVTICEEVGLLGAKLLDLSMVEAKRGLALDTSGVDLVIHRAPCANKMRFEIIGREAHAGIAPETGLSAIQVAARGIARMALGRIDEETTANIGLIQGGQATNIVPRSVVLEGEARCHNPEKLARQTEHMRTCLEEAARELATEIGGQQVQAQISCEVMADYPVMNVARSAGIIGLLEQASANLGRPLDVKAAGGGSDANIFNSHGIETVILGTGMSKVHTVEEFVRVDDMVRVAGLLVEVIRLA